MAQHSGETGQQFEAAGLELVYELTRGQPWLVNALLQKCAWEIVPEKTRATIIVEQIRQTKEAWLIVFDRRDKSRDLPWEQRLSTRKPGRKALELNRLQWEPLATSQLIESICRSFSSSIPVCKDA